MKPHTQLAFVAAWILAGGLTGCDRDRPPPDSDVTFTAEERRAILKLSPLPALPPSKTNAFADNPAAARLGQRLFFDSRLSKNGAVSCATCHDPTKGFSDGLPLSEGLETTDRHSMALWNMAYQHWFFWDGRADSLWAQALGPLQNEREMGASPEHILAVVSADPLLKSAYERIFGPLGDTGSEGAQSIERSLSNIGKALEAYQRLIISTGSPFDHFVAGLRQNPSAKSDSTQLSLSAQRGLKFFVGRGQCILCHAGPNFSDGEFHNIGLPKLPDLPGDKGRFVGVRKVKTDPFNGKGEFSDDQTPDTNIKLRYLATKLSNLGELKTPTLRNVATTAPYMHDGRFATLREVFDFYSELPDEPPYGHREETLVPLDLTGQEKADVEAFLKSLTGAPLDESLTFPPLNADLDGTARKDEASSQSIE